MSKLIFNFGSPLSGEVLEGIRGAVGENLIVNIHPYLGLNATVGDQVIELCRAAVERYGRPDYVIPPGHALAAIFVDRFFSRAEDDFPPTISYRPIIRLVQIGQAPPVFTFGGIE